VQEYLGRQLALTHKVLHDLFDAELVEAGSSLTTWIVLRNAARAEEPLSQRALADRMGLEAPTLVPQLDRLEREGFIARRRDPRDRRVVRIEVTPAGLDHIEQMTEIADRHESDLRAVLTDDEDRALRTSLAKLHAHFSLVAQERAQERKAANANRAG
jgi:MarR family transcriptional regulator for hemolysin